MNTYFKCEVRYLKMSESGEEKETTEAYLVEAINYTEAETRIHKMMSELISKTFIVMKIDKFKLTDLIDHEFGADFFLSKSSFLSVSDRGKEKKVTERALINANSLSGALDKLKAFQKQHEHLHIRIEAIVECPIIEVFTQESMDSGRVERQLRRDMKGIEFEMSIQ